MAFGAAANEVLNKIGAVEARRRGAHCLVRSIGWGPWDGGMVTAPLAAHFRSRGVGLIPLASGAHAFVRGFLFRGGVLHRDRLTSSVRRAYLAPHPSWSSRTGILEFPRQLPDGPQAPISPWLGEVHDRLVALADHPVLIVWAEQDPASQTAPSEAPHPSRCDKQNTRP